MAMVFALGLTTATAFKVLGTRHITKVVNMLEDMSKKSKEEGAIEKEAFCKLKTFCDDTLKEKAHAIEELKLEITTTQNRIESLVALGEALSDKKAQIEADIQKLNQTQVEAEGVRQSEKDDFEKEEASMSSAIDQLNEAIETLSTVGGDQTQASAAMMMQLIDSSQPRNFLAPTPGSPQAKALELAALLQLGVPGDHQPQSGEVTGMLKQTRDTYVKNLAELREKEATNVDAHAKYIVTLTDETNDLKKMLEKTGSGISSVEEELPEKRKQLDQAQENLDATTKYRMDLESECSEKFKINENPSFFVHRRRLLLLRQRPC